jgi:hypothetical protein
LGPERGKISEEPRRLRKGEHMEEKDLNSIDNIEVEPLSDDDLESVSGGSVCPTNSCSTEACSNGALQDLS